MTQPSDLEMIDCAWLACDTFGRLAVLITAGSGPVPAAVFEGPVDIFDIEERLWALPYNGTVRLRLTPEEVPSFTTLAERGLFVFDWSDIHRTHHLTNALSSWRRHRPLAICRTSRTISVAPPNGSGWTST